MHSGTALIQGEGRINYQTYSFMLLAKALRDISEYVERLPSMPMLNVNVLRKGYGICPYLDNIFNIKQWSGHKAHARLWYCYLLSKLRKGGILFRIHLWWSRSLAEIMLPFLAYYAIESPELINHFEKGRPTRLVWSDTHEAIKYEPALHGPDKAGRLSDRPACRSAAGDSWWRPPSESEREVCRMTHRARLAHLMSFSRTMAALSQTHFERHLPLIM